MALRLSWLARQVFDAGLKLELVVRQVSLTFDLLPCLPDGTCEKHHRKLRIRVSKSDFRSHALRTYSVVASAANDSCHMSR
jgi:hypothetical protein